jgi:hypothetical protein
MVTDGKHEGAVDAVNPQYSEGLQGRQNGLLLRLHAPGDTVR